MTKALRRFEEDDLEVKVYEDKSIRCMDILGNKVFIRPKMDLPKKYRLVVFCDENPRTSEEEILETIHKSIDIYYGELGRKIYKSAKERTKSVIDMVHRDTKKNELTNKRQLIRRIYETHTRIYDFVENKGRDPKKEIDMYQYYIERIEYGKTDEVLYAMAQKFNKTINSLRTLMNWYNNNFLYLHKNIREFIDGTTIECFQSCVSGNARAAGDYREHILASINTYKLNF